MICHTTLYQFQIEVMNTKNAKILTEGCYFCEITYKSNVSFKNIMCVIIVYDVAVCVNRLDPNMKLLILTQYTIMMILNCRYKLPVSNATQKWRMGFHMKSINKPVINYKALYTIYLRHRKQLLSNEIYKYQRTTRSLVADILLFCLLSESSSRCHGTSHVLIQYLYLRQKAETTSITEAETKWPTLGKQYFPNHHLQWKLCGDGN